MNSIAIIISTHGTAAEQLLKTTEMLLGKQNNVAYIDFSPGENTDTLITKYNEKLMHLKSSQGVIFLVDTWGGSPFNAASNIVTNKNNYQVITGVNIPMLIELFMARDDHISFDELVLLAIETGRAGIRMLNAKKSISVTPSLVKTTISTPSILLKPTNHMKICLIRIDDRLIHGQVATCWTKETNVNRIIVVSTEVAADPIRSTLLKQVAPPGVTAHVVDVDKMIRVYNNVDYAKDSVMLLFNNLTDIVRFIERSSINIKSINIGGMAFRKGKIQITSAVSVDNKDIEALKILDARGIELEVRKVPNESRLNMMDLLKKINNS
ncbi:PTS system mannose-specific EIIAB component [Candidatus Profftia lariciata]|uniref:PTS mannose transporter subunit IIAB n=1 Tax=Candidatus Profftia lariciata TaxID=1987921 RepID=UPI001D01C9DE|nr:PTS mannose transporter subunit IIAB [Candidatus Profftia lariciata]UDG81593.1 PTS system mannose-specific EIIAB component [Candidatus Profftia lariciata]